MGVLYDALPMNMRCLFLAPLLLLAAPPDARPVESCVVKDVDTAAVEAWDLDLTEAALFRADGHLAVKVDVVGDPRPERLRVFLDVDGPDHGEPASGAEYLVEGGRFYRYPEGGRGWAWNAVTPPPVLVRAPRGLICVLPEIEALSRARCYVETTKPDLAPADRLPNDGAVEFRLEALPELPRTTCLVSEDVAELIGKASRTLSFRLDTEVKARIWKRLEPQEMPPLQWEPVFGGLLPVQVSITDAATGKTVPVSPEEALVSSNTVRWMGSAMGIEWMLMIEPGAKGEVVVTGELSAEEERCVRVSVGCETDLQERTWHGDLGPGAAMERGRSVYRRTVPSRFGTDGLASVYPFAAVSGTGGVLVAETDPAEPRIHQVVADAEHGFFGIHYDLGLSPLTSNFPGRASFRCAFWSLAGGDNAFRRVVEGFYRRHPAFAEGGLAARAVSAATIGELGSWTYAFDASCLERQTAPEAARVLGLVAMGNDAQAEEATAVLVGGARRADGLPDAVFGDEELPAMAVEVNPDPDLGVEPELPLSPAMLGWRRAKWLLQDAETTGVRVRAPTVLRSADYSPAAIGVADFPCTYERDVGRACLAPLMAACEYAAALSGALGAREKELVCDLPWPGSFVLAQYAGMLGETLGVLGPDGYRAYDGGDLHVRRIAAGRKPFQVTAVCTGPVSPEAAAAYLRESLFWGFVPGFVGVDAAEGPGEDVLGPARAEISSYVPLILRLAEAGWNPVSEARPLSPSLEVEAFGRSTGGVMHVTLRNTSRDPLSAELALPAYGEPLLVVNPLTAEYGFMGTKAGKCPVELVGGGVQVLDVVPVSRVNDELAFMKGWTSGAGEADACGRTLRSAVEELDLGVVCSVAYGKPAVRGEENPLRFSIQNLGPEKVEVSAFKLISSKHFRPFGADVLAVEPGAQAEVEASFTEEDMGDDPWLEVQWQLRQGDKERLCARMIRPLWRDPVEFRVTARDIRASGLDAAIILPVRNYSRVEQELAVRWQGDFKGGKTVEKLAPGAVSAVRLPVRAKRAGEGQMFVRASLGGEQVFEGWFELAFEGAGPN